MSRSVVDHGAVLYIRRSLLVMVCQKERKAEPKLSKIVRVSVNTPKSYISRSETYELAMLALALRLEAVTLRVISNS
jgi:hypothetical protein